MKPISLAIAGLHSFREKQIIDFQALCEGGVFGIFGPTGSGKSTILDAMTLALFGSVERATNHTHGIMNHAENELFVSFTFELENAAGTKRYTVERSFKRGDEWRLKSGTSRLMEIGEEKIVLADKLTDVNKKIEQLLGLEMKDFTRAVVLPQGKFAEFLSLKGAERRQMLQRLFHLEPYGDRLNKKLKEKLALVSNELNEVIAEQTGLGDASKEALEQAEQDFHACRQLLEKRKIELQEMEAELEKQKQLWAWQNEKEALEAELAKLADEEEQIRALERKKEKAEQAERLRPYLEQYETSIHLLTAAQEKLTELEQKRMEAEKRYKEALNHYERARQEKATNEPQLLSKKEQLGQAKRLIVEMKGFEAELHRIIQQLKMIEEEEQNNDKQLHAVEQLYARGLEKQQMLKHELQKQIIPMEERERLDRAYEEAQQIKRIEESIREIKERLVKKEQAWGTKQTEKEKKQQQAEIIQEKLHRLFAQIEKTYHYVCEREWQLIKNMEKHERQLQAVQEKLEKAKTERLAVLLAEQLRQGEPCPVCGSLEHPNPRQHVEGDQDDHEAVRVIEQRLKQEQSQMPLIHTLKAQLEHLAHSIIDETGNEWVFQPLDVSQLVVEETNIIVETKALQQDYLALKEAIQNTIQQFRLVEKAKQQLEHEMRLLEADVKELQQQEKERTEEYVEAKNKWRKTYNDLDFMKVDQLREQIRQREKIVQQLQKRIDDSIPFLENKLQEKEQLQQQQRELEKEKIRLISLQQAKQELINEYKAKLSEQVGIEHIEQQLAYTEQQLVRLKKQEESAYEQWQQAQKHYQMLDSEAKAARQSAEDGKKRYEAAKEQWFRELRKTPFQHEQEVKAAFTVQEVRAAWEEHLSGYWQQVQHVQAQLKKVTEAMNGQTIEKHKWEEAQSLYREMKQGVDEMIQQLGAAQSKLEELMKKHKRFVELEEKRKTLALLVERYKHLQSILKGNSFVEFMAEEQLIQVTRMASERLGSLTRQRYAIEVDSQGGFVIRDDANGGIRRPVTTLSGGETFLTSLSLALALSAQIQLRGEYPLQFFFLDEGFGTLDSELLDTVISALEKLHSKRLSIGVISHVQEIRERLPKRLIVEPAEPSGRGTRVKLEIM